MEKGGCFVYCILIRSLSHCVYPSVSICISGLYLYLFFKFLLLLTLSPFPILSIQPHAP